MSREVTLWSDVTSPRSAQLRFTDGEKRRSSFVCSATLGLDGEELGVELHMISAYADFMLDFFESMAQEAGGWEGEKSWQSEFGEMTIVATNDGNVAQFDVTMLVEGHEWEHRAAFAFRPSELRRLAEEIRVFLDIPPESRPTTFRRNPNCF